MPLPFHPARKRGGNKKLDNRSGRRFCDHLDAFHNKDAVRFAFFSLIQILDHALYLRIMSPGNHTCYIDLKTSYWYSLMSFFIASASSMSKSTISPPV